MSHHDLGPISIVCVDSVADRLEISEDLDPIFFSASATQSFPSESVKAEFRERWLGRYLTFPADRLYVAKDLGHGGRVAGYLVGCFQDPAIGSRFDDIGYFRVLKALTAAYPAHLHINFDRAYRNRGLGGKLIDAFASDCVEHGCLGVHVVTGAQSLSRPFYARNGFDHVHQFDWSGQSSVFLGRKLSCQ
ncbi:MAG: GNAT family N-acetyltransferase [Hyphomicrobiaceae bacterium]